MTPTTELRAKLRKLLDERIPNGGSDADTRFSDAEVDELLSEATNIYSAAAIGWTRKAAMFQREAGQIQSYSVGQERYETSNPKDLMEYALKMAEIYRRMAASSIGSVILKFKPPEVL